MKSLIIGPTVLALLFAVPASARLAQDPHSDPKIIDFEVHCKAEIDAYARSKGFEANSPVYHHNVHSVFVLPDTRERLAAFQWSLRHIMSKRKPNAQEFLTLCTVNRYIAQLDGAPLATRRASSDGFPATAGKTTKAAPTKIEKAPNPASEFAYNFLKEVVCLQIPLAGCDVLDRDNAINVLRASQAVLVNKYCGTGNIQAAKQMVETETSLDNDRCRSVLKGIGAI